MVQGLLFNFKVNYLRKTYKRMFEKTERRKKRILEKNADENLPWSELNKIFERSMEGYSVRCKKKQRHQTLLRYG